MTQIPKRGLTFNFLVTILLRLPKAVIRQQMSHPGVVARPGYKREEAAPGA
jgi:hypothetical protein